MEAKGFNLKEKRAKIMVEVKEQHCFDCPNKEKRKGGKGGCPLAVFGTLFENRCSGPDDCVRALSEVIACAEERRRNRCDEEARQNAKIEVVRAMLRMASYDNLPPADD